MSPSLARLISEGDQRKAQVVADIRRRFKPDEFMTVLESQIPPALRALQARPPVGHLLAHLLAIGLAEVIEELSGPQDDSAG